jgi:hypothetical protein
MADNNSNTSPAVVVSAEILDGVTDVRTFSLRNAEAGAKQAVKSADKVLPYLAGIRQSIRTAEGEKAVAAAYAIKVGKAHGIKQGDVATAIGVSPSMGTLYVRMGLAHEKGVEIGSDTWKALHSSAWANDKEVAKVLTDSSKGLNDVEAAVEGKRARVAAAESGSGSGSGGSGNGGDGGNGSDLDLPRGFNKRVEMMNAIVAGFPSDPTDNQWKSLEEFSKSFAAYMRTTRAKRKSAA